ncbi:MAG: mandelate racemase [Proteobacteria bacterium]|nr:mandelate racemase [Pseudomonadota bacterium]MDA0875874.1 mandelate racemase [Pseudomonadota bacterium]
MNTPLEIRAWKLRLPLTSPYRLSFGPVTAFETVFIQIDLPEGQRGLGEATFLTGYTDEVFEESWSFLEQWITRQQTLEQFNRALTQLADSRPFLTSALRSALDMAACLPVLRSDRELRAPVLGLLQGNNKDQLEQNLRSLLQQGYRTLKLKVGFEPTRDGQFVNDVAALCKSMPQAAGLQSELRLRVDANQGFSSDQAIGFLKELRPASVSMIELFEQPCLARDWAAHARVVPCAKDSGIQLMLDESIFGEADIQRAGELQLASFIKVKLMKFEGLEALMRAIALIKQLGMTPVLGNGVASDLNCWMEGCVAALCIDNAGEMNGYLKQRASPLIEPLAFADGHLCAAAGWRPVLNMDALDALQEGQIRVSIEH